MLYHHPRPSAVDPSDPHLPDNAIIGPGRMADIFLDAARAAVHSVQNRAVVAVRARRQSDLP
jgi:hypothetical protein